MKVYSIGREVGCDIVINDSTDVISRRHAILNVTSSGKMTIVDQSHNGTYVNGIRISPNVPVPVTRKDNISFAHVARLDWNLIPNTNAFIMRWATIGLVAVLIIAGGIWGYRWLSQPEPPVNTTDSTLVSRQDVEEKLRNERQKIQEHIKDSLRRDSLRRDSIRKAENRKAEQKKKADAKKEKKKETPKQQPKPKNEGTKGVGGRPKQ